MQHIPRMRALAYLPLLLSFAASAADSDSRMAVMRTILAFNEGPPRQSLFTANASIAPEFDRLWDGKRLSYGRVAPSEGARPTIQISHEPWGEATIGFPPLRTEVVNPRVVTDEVRFVFDDVAIVDGAFVYDSEGGRQRTRLFFVLRKEHDEWKIAAVRVVV
jgi:hypothetical protein